MPYESTWVFLETSVKPYPACRMTHGAIELAADMTTRALGQSVKRITIKIAEACYGVVGERIPRKLAPQTVVDAQFSEYFQTAVSWLHGLSCGLDVYQKLRDPAVLSLSERIHVEIDNRYKGLETSMTVEWDDGTVDTEELLAPKGEPENPMEWEMVRRKFEGLANSVFGRERVEAISTAVLRLESLDLAVLGDLLLTA
jgi:2-methylcitrate dehydratase PrpD